MAARFHREIKTALALPGRGGVRNDELKLDRVSTRLEIIWSARVTHPWDCGDAPEKNAERMLEQAMEDAEAALNRLFEYLPQIDALGVTVLDPISQNTIMAGTVHRGSSPENGSSLKMRLMNRGIRFELAGLDTKGCEQQLAS